MNKLKIASFIMFIMIVFTCSKSIAQTQNDKDSQQVAPDTENQDNSAAQPQGTDENASVQPSSVTIDSGTASGGTYDNTGDTGTRKESTTKIHIYSGKQDGNNVINPDPKN
jgi:hypothetical protein